MGYYTYFTMEARNIKNEEEYNSIIYAMKERELMQHNGESGIFDEGKYYDDSHRAYFEAYDECKWYDHEYDMMKFSRLFPDVTFRLSGDGEEREDMWHKYFHNGEVEECRAEIKFPTPIYIEWDE